MKKDAMNSPQPPKWVARVKSIMKKRGLIQDDLCEPLGVKTRGAVGHYFTGRAELDVSQAINLSAFLDIDLALLISDQKTDTFRADNLSRSPHIKGYIPLISWVQAGSWSEAIDLYQPGDAESVHPTTINHGLHTFALRVDGDSMTAPTGAAGHSFPHGMIIYIDPDQEASPGDYVIARHNGHGHVTFKQYGTEEGRPVLKPLNTNGQYPIIREEFQIIGKVIDASWGGL